MNRTLCERGRVVIAPSARGGTIENYENLAFTMNHIDGNVHDAQG